MQNKTYARISTHKDPTCVTRNRQQIPDGVVVVCGKVSLPVDHLHQPAKIVINVLRLVGRGRTRLQKQADGEQYQAQCEIKFGHQQRRLSITGPLIFLHPWGTLSIMSYQDRITIDPAKRGGKPCIRSLRITVYDVLEYLASGMSEADILKDFPDLTREDIRACLEFAADRERKLVSLPSQ